ncbi:hypothetical protein PACID_09340 [Acidipropionibacterium acidipropionici ATCC 4875]|uniref:Uncharacterized protein n=1 Tax=Acidipropionibacterium acidipropionici (strain ATCC 4875 / DSM 20272 / JCM 6432 / NBRC 12425 / NCIMB 8070 / 4) TaxID=1171373 RepID=K7RR36_ACIA4|nr:hypothetical protein [Acidipropionibacterium acidipropionici]AFV88771.1 hypothetical protein PACID_09340 [Acidipropionibacterium acidipropionici ATCC 4875]
MTAITLDKSFTEDLTRDKGFNTTAASVIALGISLVLAIAGIVVSSDLMVIIGGFLAVTAAITLAWSTVDLSEEPRV